jgi:hypothetical protein
MRGIPLENNEGDYTIMGLIPMATYIVELTATDNADNETVKTKEVVANGVIIIIPP